MCLISEYVDIPGFGICYGGGCCKTCGVMIEEANRSGKKFVLACEVRIDDELAGKSVTIL
jgi:hypothetical protein